MKIAFLSDSIYPFNKGGKETRSYELANQLSKKHDVHVYTMKFWKGKEVNKQYPFCLHGLCEAMPLYKNNKRDMLQGLTFGIASLKMLTEDFDVLDADHMVYLHLLPAKLACLIKGKPLIITWHEVWGKEYWQKYLGWKGIFGYWIEKLSSMLPNKIIAVSEQTKQNLISQLKVKPEKIFVIPNAINLSEIDKVKPSKERSDIIFTGRLNEHKNIDILIKAMTHLKDKKLIIVGDGPEMENLKGLVKSLKLDNVIFKGFVKDIKDVYALMKSSKVFVLPSTREGFGISVIEANACGIPAITINHKDNASKHLIQKDNKNGYTTNLNEKDIANTIAQSLKKKNWSNDCKSCVSKYDWSNIIKMFEGVYGK